MATDQPRTFKKTERLCSLKLIEALFADKHHSLSAYPLRAVFMTTDAFEHEPVQVLISVSKRRFHHAVDRNRVKRQVREAYRQHKDLLWPAVPQEKGLALAFLWLSDEHFPSNVVEQKVVNLLSRVAEYLRQSQA